PNTSTPTAIIPKTMKIVFFIIQPPFLYKYLLPKTIKLNNKNKHSKILPIVQTILSSNVLENNEPNTTETTGNGDATQAKVAIRAIKSLCAIGCTIMC